MTPTPYNHVCTNSPGLADAAARRDQGNADKSCGHPHDHLPGQPSPQLRYRSSEGHMRLIRAITGYCQATLGHWKAERHLNRLLKRRDRNR
jgi:hypothetical protein